MPRTVPGGLLEGNVEPFPFGTRLLELFGHHFAEGNFRVVILLLQRLELGPRLCRLGGFRCAAVAVRDATSKPITRSRIIITQPLRRRREGGKP